MTKEEEQRRAIEREALDTRIALFELTKRYENTNKFPLSVEEFAHLLLYMHENFEKLKVPNLKIPYMFKKAEAKNVS